MRLRWCILGESPSFIERWESSGRGTAWRYGDDNFIHTV